MIQRTTVQLERMGGTGHVSVLDSGTFNASSKSLRPRSLRERSNLLTPAENIYGEHTKIHPYALGVRKHFHRKQVLQSICPTRFCAMRSAQDQLEGSRQQSRKGCATCVEQAASRIPRRSGVRYTGCFFLMSSIHPPHVCPSYM